LKKNLEIIVHFKILDKNNPFVNYSLKDKRGFLMKAIILAGGYATRLWPITRDLAKPLLPLGKKRIIEYVIDQLIDIPDIDEIYISTNKFFEKQFYDWLNDSNFDNVRLFIEETYSEEEKLGTIRALSLIFKHITSEDYLIIAGDNIFSFHLHDFIKTYHTRKAPLVAVYDIKDISRASRYGVVEIDDKNRIISFVEKPSKPKTSLIATACYAMSRDIAEKVHEYISLGLNPDSPGRFIEWLHKFVAVYAYKFSGYWFDIGHADSYIGAFEYLLSESHISENANIDEDSTIKHPVVIEDKAEIRSSIVGPYAYIGKGVIINHSEISNSIVFSDTKMENSSVKKSIISFSAVLKKVSLKHSLIGAYTKIFYH